jgi:hypothetical protein
MIWFLVDSASRAISFIRSIALFHPCCVPRSGFVAVASGADVGATVGGVPATVTPLVAPGGGVTVEGGVSPVPVGFGGSGALYGKSTFIAIFMPNAFAACCGEVTPAYVNFCGPSGPVVAGATIFGGNGFIDGWMIQPCATYLSAAT